MKKTLMLAGLLLGLLLTGAACTSQPHKTIDNLKAAIAGETQAAAQYMAFAQKATEEGYHNIAKLFIATSKAEAAHVDNHQAVLANYNVLYTAQAKPVEVGTTMENLQKALDGEIYETEQMYPLFLQDAETDKVDAAVASFKWAMGAEQLHAQFYGESMRQLAIDNTDANISPAWHLCPKCGFIYKSLDGVSQCELCGADVASFEAF